MSNFAARILVVEDEIAQQETLAYNLEHQGYTVVVASDGEEAVFALREQEFDLVLLDWMLPALSGIEICRRLKRDERTRRIPVIMLSARGDDADKVQGLDTGADDYLAKPYSIPELMARVRSQLRRKTTEEEKRIIEASEISVDPQSRRVWSGGKEIPMGSKEFRLLATLMSRPDRVWTRDQLLSRVWNDDLDIETRTVDVHIGRLRKALTRFGAEDPIRTVRGSGYSFSQNAKPTR